MQNSPFSCSVSTQFDNFCGNVACEQQTHFRSSLLSLRKIAIFRRETSDDRKCVCCSQARLTLACSRLRDSGEKSFGKKKCEKRAGAGERQGAATAPQVARVLFSLCSFNTSPLYYLRAWHRLGSPVL